MLHYLLLLGAFLPGAGFTLIAGAYFRSWLRLRRHGQRAVGTVRRQCAEATGRGGSYATTFGFVTARGEAVEAESALSLPFRAWREGAAVTVYYDPARPQQCLLDSRAERVGYVVLALLGCLATGLILRDALTSHR